jgi:hypothetical protein
MGQIPGNTVEMCSDNNGNCTDGKEHDFNDEETNVYSEYGTQCSSVFVFGVIQLMKAVTDEKLGKRKPKGNRKNRENSKKDAQEAGNNLRKYHLYKTYINSCI